MQPVSPTAGNVENPPAGERWGRVPCRWLDHPAVDADALAVLTALATFADRRGRCWPSQTTLAAKLKRSRAWVNKTLSKLAEAGLLTVKDRWSENGGRLSCLYILDTGAPERKDDTPVVTATAPCQPSRHEQPEPEHIPDSPAVAAQGAAVTPDADWSPSAEDLAWAQNRHDGVDLDRHVEGFRLRCRAHGYRYRDVGAAWRAWLDQDAAAGKAPSAGKSSSTDRGVNRRRSTNPPPSRQAVAEQTLDAWRAVAARLQSPPAY